MEKNSNFCARFSKSTFFDAKLDKLNVQLLFYSQFVSDQKSNLRHKLVICFDDWIRLLTHNKRPKQTNQTVN